MRLKWKIGLLAGAAVLALGGATIVSATQDADWLKTRLPMQWKAAQVAT